MKNYHYIYFRKNNYVKIHKFMTISAMYYISQMIIKYSPDGLKVCQPNDVASRVDSIEKEMYTKS